MKAFRGDAGEPGGMRERERAEPPEPHKTLRALQLTGLEVSG